VGDEVLFDERISSNRALSMTRLSDLIACAYGVENVRMRPAVGRLECGNLSCCGRRISSSWHARAIMHEGGGKQVGEATYSDALLRHLNRQEPVQLSRVLDLEQAGALIATEDGLHIDGLQLVPQSRSRSQHGVQFHT